MIMNKLLKTISYLGVGGICFIAGKYKDYLDVKKALDSDWTKREFNRRFNEEGFIITKKK